MTNIEPSYGPCQDWTDLASVRGCDCDESVVEDAMITDAIPAVSELLFTLSGKQFSGECARTVRPVGCCVCSGWWQSYGTLPYYGGRALPFQYDTPSSVVHLGYEPLRSITEVRVNDVVMPSDKYRIDDWRWLVLETQNESWPCCSRLTPAAGSTDTWSVGITYGMPLPQMATRAAAKLVCEFAKACTPAAAGECKLPKRVQSIVRQGFSAVLLDPFDMLDNGKLGVYEVDAFIKAYNPEGLMEDATVVTPDMMQRSTLTTWRA